MFMIIFCQKNVFLKLNQSIKLLKFSKAFAAIGRLLSANKTLEFLGLAKNNIENLVNY